MIARLLYEIHIRENYSSPLRTVKAKQKRSPFGDMMHLLRKHDVAPVGRNDAMFAQCAVRHTSFAKRTSLGEAVIICRRQTSFKKRTFVLVDKSAFFVVKSGQKRYLGEFSYRLEPLCVIVL